MRSLLVALVVLFLTPILAFLVVVSAALRVPDRPGGVYWWAPRVWARALVWAAGVKVRVHGADRVGSGREGQIFASNHVSWYDVFVLAATLPRYSFVAKAEIMRIPVFGAAARACGNVGIERNNRKAAFASYDDAAKIVRSGRPVVVFPEGTRGYAYPLRSFKKGPFVLAIAAGVPVVPVILHGTLGIMPKGGWRIRSGVVDIHFLEPVVTAGLSYEERDELSSQVRSRMTEELERDYGVTSPPATQGTDAEETSPSAA